MRGTTSGSATADAQVGIFARDGLCRLVWPRRNHAPDRIVGPFESSDEADRHAAGQPEASERYAVVELLTPPSN
jgi:hypothetical protein